MNWRPSRSASPRSSASASSTIAWSCTASHSTATAKDQARLTPRAALRIAGLLLLFAVLAPIHIATKLLFRRSRWPRRFLAAAAWIIGARVRTEGTAPRPGTLLVPNHTTWLDILVLGGATGCAFVSKDQLGHSLVHWLADQNRTIYVNRSARRQVGEQTEAIASALQSGEVVAFFPEGTVGPGHRLLPFRSPLFEAAAQAADVRPAVIDYGSLATEISWFEQDGKANILRVLGRLGTIPVTIRLLDRLPPGDRKQLAAAASAEIERALGFKSPPQSPIGKGQ